MDFFDECNANLFVVVSIFEPLLCDDVHVASVLAVDFGLNWQLLS